MNYHQTLEGLIDLANHELLRKMDALLSKNNIPVSSEQFKMVWCLLENDGISQQKLANKIGRNRASTGRMVDTLYNKGLLKRVAKKDDKRINLIVLTDKGKALEFKIRLLKKEIDDFILNILGEKGINDTKKALEKIINGF